MATQTIMQADLDRAYNGSWYFIAGTGGDLGEWLDGYERLLRENHVGTPTGWYRTTGAEVNAYAESKGGNGDPFQPDLMCLLFPLDGMSTGRLASFKLRMQDRWFDDVIDNMVRHADPDYEGWAS